jgi:hypothetical protein
MFAPIFNSLLFSVFAIYLTSQTFAKAEELQMIDTVNCDEFLISTVIYMADTKSLIINDDQSRKKIWVEIGSTHKGYEFLSYDPKQRCVFLKKNGTYYHSKLLHLGKSQWIKNLVRNANFDSQEPKDFSDWKMTGTNPPFITKEESQSGESALKVALEGKQQDAFCSSGVIEIKSGSSYNLSLWAKQTQADPRYVTQYQIEWNNGKKTTYKNFNTKGPDWKKVSLSKIVAPEGATGATVKLRFATGSGKTVQSETYIDTLELTEVIE